MPHIFIVLWTDGDMTLRRRKSNIPFLKITYKPSGPSLCVCRSVSWYVRERFWRGLVARAVAKSVDFIILWMWEQPASLGNTVDRIQTRRGACLPAYLLPGFCSLALLLQHASLSCTYSSKHRSHRMASQDAKIASFVARLNEPTTSSSHTHADSSKAQEDDEDIFAELEAEIENDSSAAFREQGMDRIKRE